MSDNLFPKIRVIQKDEDEKIHNLPICIDCKEERVVLKLEPHRKTQMRVCVNKDCWRYSDFEAILSWKR